MSYSISSISDIIRAEFRQRGDDVVIEQLLTDSRKLIFPSSSLFFSLPGSGRRGDDFIDALYDKGVRNFVVNEAFLQPANLPHANILVVPDVLAALQQLAAAHRAQFNYPVIGITGSNGKTIVKEWLYQLLNETFEIVRSPKSYNSQTGVPLSIWRMDTDHNLGIFEAGISMPDEMDRLAKIIQPTLGVLTFIGSAHAEHFENTSGKIREKLRLFAHAKALVFCADDESARTEIEHFVAAGNPALILFGWGKHPSAQLRLLRTEKNMSGALITCKHNGKEFAFRIPFFDEASVHNALSCCAAALCLGVGPELITEKAHGLRPLEMRLELKEGINNCSIINDSYSADADALAIALDFLAQQKRHSRRTIILSDFLETDSPDADFYGRIAEAVSRAGIQRVIAVGEKIGAQKARFNSIPEFESFADTDALLCALPSLRFEDETVLLKGARIFRFERISRELEKKVHETILEINLNALRHNLRVYREQLKPGVKVMAMVKAFSYGSGSFEIANLLQHAGAEYLAVAYADEGADLRRNNISLPIMVMNTEAAGFESIVRYQLEPELYSFGILNEFKSFLRARNISAYPVHIKFDTGMHRLGFETADASALAALLKGDESFKVLSVFSHLAGSDEAIHDGFSLAQAAELKRAADIIQDALPYPFMRHLANSAAAHRLPQLQMDMVRLGIGLYGADATPEMRRRLLPVATLKTTISQIRRVKKGESIGYSRRAVADADKLIATVRIGYADGFPRSLGNCNGAMLLFGNRCPVIGNVCMDMTMIDITGIDAAEGDEVIVFGEAPSVTEVAAAAGTISYEILTNISQRVKRVYYEE